MGLSTSQLEAFAAVAKTGNFSRAAKSLHITQSALSQRILNLEQELQTAIVIRDPSGLRLTAAGGELLRYWQVKDSLEAELLRKISSDHVSTSGVIRIAGFSSIMRSVVMPSLSEIVKSGPNISVELFNREVRELPNMLSNNEADLIVTSQQPFRQEIVSHSLGIEENVLVAGKVGQRTEVYLDHDPEDLTTAEFLKLNPKLKQTFRRSFLDEVYAIVDGVKLGWGKAVLPRHLVKKERGLKVASGFKALESPVFLQYFRQPYYSNLHKNVVEELCANAREILKA